MIKECNKIVFFGGAGVSTESGIKDFRSVDGLYNMNYDYPPEEILSHHFFINNLDEFYKFYIDKMNCLDALPNDCHKYLAKLEKSGKLTGIITQNIDGLHQKAGSKKVYELHGSIYKNHCTKCNKKIDAIDIFNGKYICDCGGIIRPDVVLYEEPLDDNVLSNSINLISNTDMLIIGGTSLTVYPASNLVRYFNGKYLVVINKQNTYIDNMATLVINDKIGKVFKELEKEGIY